MAERGHNNDGSHGHEEASGSADVPHPEDQESEKVRQACE